MQINRRNLIEIACAGSVVGLGGCLGGDEADDEEPLPEIETTEGPAEFAVYGVSLSSDESATVDANSNVELAIGNRGGEPGELDGVAVLESTESTQAATITADFSTIDGEIESGEYVTVTTETINFEYAGRYEATVEEVNGYRLPVADDADAAVSVDPRQSSGDSSQTFVDDLRLRVMDVQFEQSLHYDAVEYPNFFGSVDRVGLYGALDDQTLVLVHAVVENAGNNGAHIDTSAFTFGGEAALTDPGTGLQNIRDMDSDPLHTMSVNPGSQVRGWFLFNLPKAAVTDANLAFHRDGTTAPADIVWELDSGATAFPQFELVDMDVPEKRAEGRQNFDFTIENTGDATGTFRGEIEWRQGTSGDWDGRLEWNEDLVAKIPPGETATVTSGSDNDELDATYEYRLNPFGATFVVGPSE